MGVSFQHRFEPGGEPVLLLLHGTGGTEDDLIGLGKTILPEAALLSPRGKVLENGMARFFRRLAEGVFDKEDLFFRTEELAAFLDEAAGRYGFQRGNVVALGFSNGANIAASLLLRRPEALGGAILLRPMLPFQPQTAPRLTGKPVWMASGRYDSLVRPEQATALAEVLASGGAEVSHRWLETGHQLTGQEIAEAAAWAKAQFVS